MRNEDEKKKGDVEKKIRLENIRIRQPQKQCEQAQLNVKMSASMSYILSTLVHAIDAKPYIQHYFMKNAF